MQIIPELIRSREFATLGAVLMFDFGHDLYMVECWAKLETDGHNRSCRTFYTRGDAMDKFDSIQSVEDLFWELGIDYEAYQDYLIDYH